MSLAEDIANITVDLGPIRLVDAKALHRALEREIKSGYFADPEEYTSVMQVKAMLKLRIAKAVTVAAYAEPA